MISPTIRTMKLGMRMRMRTTTTVPESNKTTSKANPMVPTGHRYAHQSPTATCPASIWITVPAMPERRLTAWGVMVPPAQSLSLANGIQHRHQMSEEAYPSLVTNARDLHLSPVNFLTPTCMERNPRRPASLRMQLDLRLLHTHTAWMLT